MHATISWSDESGFWIVTDEYGDVWAVFVVDGAHAAVQRETADGCEAAYFNADAGGSNHGTIDRADDGQTFGVNCSDEYTVYRGQWTEASARCLRLRIFPDARRRGIRNRRASTAAAAGRVPGRETLYGVRRPAPLTPLGDLLAGVPPVAADCPDQRCRETAASGGCQTQAGQGYSPTAGEANAELRGVRRAIRQARQR